MQLNWPGFGSLGTEQGDKEVWVGLRKGQVWGLRGTRASDGERPGGRCRSWEAVSVALPEGVHERANTLVTTVYARCCSVYVE